MDVSHFPFVHENLLGTRDQTEVAATDVVETEFGLTYFYEQEEPNELYSSDGQMTRWDYTLYTPFTIHLRKTIPNGEETVISLVSAPTSPKLTHMYFFLARNHRQDEDDATWSEFSNTIMNQDQVIVESQRPEEIPTDLREELHLRCPTPRGLLIDGGLCWRSTRQPRSCHEPRTPETTSRGIRLRGCKERGPSSRRSCTKPPRIGFWTDEPVHPNDEDTVRP